MVDDAWHNNCPFVVGASYLEKKFNLQQHEIGCEDRINSVRLYVSDPIYPLRYIMHWCNAKNKENSWFKINSKLGKERLLWMIKLDKDGVIKTGPHRGTDRLSIEEGCQLKDIEGIIRKEVETYRAAFKYSSITSYDSQAKNVLRLEEKVDNGGGA